MIISGDFAPGSRLRERDLSQALAVSRVPVREALQQLKAEGFIDTSPRRGATVKQITLRDVNELFDVRLSLEVLAARSLHADRAPRPPVQCAEHLSLCRAIYDGKAELAAALAFAHVELGRELSLQGLAGRLPEG